tara:strand:+ start:294 stop:674 length:381 start_codon:yes stop_codon:yes gene_type:complete
MSLLPTGANYNGRQPNNTSYIKTYITGSVPSSSGTWNQTSYSGNGISQTNVLTPSDLSRSLYIPNNIILDGKLILTNKQSNSKNNESQEEINEIKVKIAFIENKLDNLTEKVNNLLSYYINDQSQS